jgi:hypothetical protein
MDPMERIRTSFAKQGLMTTLGATLGAISPGAVEIILSPARRSRSSTALSMPGP